MNWKIVVLAVALMAVALLALSTSQAFATKPIPFSDQQFWLLITELPSPFMSLRPMGTSANIMVYWTDLPVAFVGTITGNGVYNGQTLLKNGVPESAYGVVTLTDAVVDGNTGDLTIRMETKSWTIIGGTDELKSLHGTGTFAPDAVIPILYLLDGQIHFDP